VRTCGFLGVEPIGKRISRESVDMYRARPDGQLNWHFFVTDWNYVRLQLRGEAGSSRDGDTPGGPDPPNGSFMV
jgi:hypothetical protein